MQLISKHLEHKLTKSRVPKTRMIGDCWYSMLTNQDYVKKFAYIPTYLKNRHEMIVDGDSEDNNNFE